MKDETKNTFGPKLLGRNLISATEHKIESAKPYIIKGLLLSKQVSILAGPPNIGKSSVVACLAAHTAMGQKFGKLRVNKAMVIYIAAEDPHGIADRAYAYWKDEEKKNAHFFILDRAIDLTDRDMIYVLLKEVKELIECNSANHVLIVIDTLNLCIGGGDENSAKDMAQVITSAEVLAEGADAHVMIIHHTTSGDNAKPRGSTAILGNVDTVILLRKEENQQNGSLFALIQQKQRSVRKGETILFEMGSREVGKDEDGQSITVPVVFPHHLNTDKQPNNEKTSTTLTLTQIREVEILRVLTQHNSSDPQAFMRLVDLMAAVKTGFDSVRDRKDSFKKALSRALDNLEKGRKCERDRAGDVRLYIERAHGETA